jgi:glucose-1-phosphate adenylyltransferase
VWAGTSSTRRSASTSTPCRPQQRFVDRWYEGTADAIFQNLHILNRERSDRVLILSGDHVYKMDYRAMLSAHAEAGAALTIATFEIPIDTANQFGVLEVDEQGLVIGFHEKPENPEPAPGRPGMVLANMGVYVFDTEALVRSVVEDSRRDSAHDFGMNIIPALVESGARVQSYPFVSHSGKPAVYWRDVGTIDAYFEAHMDLIQPDPPITLRDPGWPLRTWQRQFPPAYIGHGRDGSVEEVEDSLVAAGAEIRGGNVIRSVLSPGVSVRSDAVVEESILLDGVSVGRGAVVKRAVIDKQVRIPDGYVLGGDPERDRQMFSVSPSGLVTVEKLAVLG